MITYSQPESNTELEGILALQKANLASGLSAEEIRSQGFVTVNHTFELLKKLNEQEKHVIAKDHERVVGYVLAMTPQARFDIPVLVPMFEAFDEMTFDTKRVTDYKYIVVGQVCVDKHYRGQGVFDGCYSAYRKYYRDKYDFAITEIAANNLRSLHAHKRIGFNVINSYVAPDKVEWKVVVWDWKLSLSVF